MKNKILFVILGLILAGLIFYGGVYFDQKTSSVAEIQSDFYHDFFTSIVDGYGIIKDIDVNNSVITLSSQPSEGKTLKVNFNENTRFYQIIKWDEEKGVTEAELLELKDLKTNDKVYFACQPNKDHSFTLLWLNVATKESEK